MDKQRRVSTALNGCAAAIAVVCGVGAVIWLLAAATIRDEGPLIGAVLFLLFGSFVLAVWTFVDAWRRGDTPLAWGLLALCAGPVGWAVYMVTRRKRPSSCPMCSHPTQNDYLVCPQCGGHLRPRCRSCGRALTAGWLCCPYCATALVQDPVAAALEEIADPPTPTFVCPYHAQAAPPSTPPCAATQPAAPAEAPAPAPDQH